MGPERTTPGDVLGELRIPAAEAVRTRARAAWAEAKLEPIAYPRRRRVDHDRGEVQREALSTFLGHASITLDRYGHLLAGSITESADLLDAFLVRTGELPGERAANSLQIGEFPPVLKPLGVQAPRGFESHPRRNSARV